MDENASLHLACEKGNDNVVARLLKAGVNYNVRDITGWTPLSLAANKSHSRCVQLLLEAGSDPMISNSCGSIPLHFANDSAECTALLLAANLAGVRAVDFGGHTPLHDIAEYGTADVCSLLLDAGSVIDVVDKFGLTPLCLALRNDKRDTAELLLDRGAQLELVKLDFDLIIIPEWALEFVSHRNACKEITKVITSLRIPGLDPNLFKMLGKYVWNTRKNTKW